MLGINVWHRRNFPFEGEISKTTWSCESYSEEGVHVDQPELRISVDKLLDLDTYRESDLVEGVRDAT